MRIIMIVMLLLLTCVGSAQGGEYKNFTIFSLGYENVNYKEASGALTSSGRHMNNMMQASKAYTAINDDFGFYISTVSTLVTNSSAEQWSVSPYGTIQTNQRRMSAVDLYIDAAMNMSDGWQLTMGLGWNKETFTRAGYAYPQGVRGNCVFTATGCTFTPNASGIFQEIAPGGVVIARLDGATVEDSNSLMLRFGVRYDTFFTDDSQWRLMAGTQAAVPLYYYVTSSILPGLTWKSSFRGYNLHVDGGMGYKLTPKFDVLFLLSGDYRYRPQTNPGVGGLTVPNTKVFILRPSIGLGWSF